MAFNILIVDDSLAMRSIIKKTIDMSGFDLGEIFEGNNGEEALAILKENWVDVILTDIHMPIMDGVSLMKIQMKDPVLSSIPVVFITTEGREDRIKEIFVMGAKGYIRKPFKPEEIKKLLMEVLGVEDGYQGDVQESEEVDF